MFTLLYNLTATCSWFSLEAEEYQKLAFPASEFVLNGLLPEEELKLWAPVPRMVEFVFNSGRNGWSEEMLDNFRCLAWRYCILCEEQYGANACVINLHNLTHLPEDIQRFSAPDNFWCFEFERAVKRYVQQSSNKKHIEKSFARRESQREFLNFQQDLKLISSERCRFTWAKDKEKVIVIDQNYDNRTNANTATRFSLHEIYPDYMTLLEVDRTNLNINKGY